MIHPYREIASGSDDRGPTRSGSNSCGELWGYSGDFYDKRYAKCIPRLYNFVARRELGHHHLSYARFFSLVQRLRAIVVYVTTKRHSTKEYPKEGIPDACHTIASSTITRPQGGRALLSLIVVVQACPPVLFGEAPFLSSFLLVVSYFPAF